VVRVCLGCPRRRCYSPQAITFVRVSDARGSRRGLRRWRKRLIATSAPPTSATKRRGRGMDCRSGDKQHEEREGGKRTVLGQPFSQLIEEVGSSKNSLWARRMHNSKWGRTVGWSGPAASTRLPIVLLHVRLSVSNPCHSTRPVLLRRRRHETLQKRRARASGPVRASFGSCSWLIPPRLDSSASGRRSGRSRRAGAAVRPSWKTSCARSIQT
jgi:hypothetical protein